MNFPPDQISKLPPELQRAAELCEKAKPWPSSGWTSKELAYTNNAFYEQALTALPLALTYCLQMQEERDAANKRIKFLNDYSERRFDDAKQFHDELEIAKATIARLEQEAADDQLVFEHAQEVSGLYEAQLSRIAETVAKLPSITGLQEGCVKDHSLIWMAIRDAQDAYRDTLARHQREAQQHAKRAETAEAAIATLTRELKKVIASAERLKYESDGYGILDERLYEAKQDLQKSLIEAGAALSHTPEGRGK